MARSIELTGPRWSSASICARWCVYGAQGAPAREHTEEELLRFERGKAWGRVVADGIVARLNRDGRRPRREEVIPWPKGDPVGNGHADCYIPSESLIVEVVSNAGGKLPAYKAIQAAGYAINHPNATEAVVDSVDTHTGREHHYPLNLVKLADQVETIEQQVQAGLAGELPERVCRTPWDGPAQLCPHVDHCFAGWEPTPLDELLATTGELDLLDRLADAEDAVGDANQAKKHAEAVRNELREKVAPLIEPGTLTAAGNIAVRRTVFESERFQLSAARAAGHNLPKRLDPFVSLSESSRWTVKRMTTSEDRPL